MQGRESGEHDTERKSCPISALEEVRSRRPPCKVLLVDDEPSILIVLHWALQDIGCEVTSAHGGQAGLDAKEARKISAQEIDEELEGGKRR